MWLVLPTPTPTPEQEREARDAARLRRLHESVWGLAFRYLWNLWPSDLPKLLVGTTESAFDYSAFGVDGNDQED